MQWVSLSEVYIAGGSKDQHVFRLLMTSHRSDDYKTSGIVTRHDYEEEVRYTQPAPKTGPRPEVKSFQFIIVSRYKQVASCRIWGFHSSDYEECRLLGWNSSSYLFITWTPSVWKHSLERQCLRQPHERLRFLPQTLKKLQLLLSNIIQRHVSFKTRRFGDWTLCPSSDKGLLSWVQSIELVPISGAIHGIVMVNESYDQSKSKSRYNWWSVSQYVLVSSPLWDLWPDITFCLKVTFIINVY
jgi:hypothetical protein